MKRRVALVPSQTRCLLCGGPIVWRRTSRGEWLAVNVSGAPHAWTCRGGGDGGSAVVDLGDGDDQGVPSITGPL